MKLYFVTLIFASTLLLSSSCRKKTNTEDSETVEFTIDDEDDDLSDLDDLLGDDNTEANLAPENSENSINPVLDSQKDSQTPAESTQQPVQAAQTKQNQVTEEPPRKVKATVSTVDPAQSNQLMRYNVVVATLSKQDGVNRLSKHFDRDGISYFVVKSGGFYMFVVASSDSEDAAIDARKNFLLKTTVDKTRKQIWSDYDIEVTDSYILERR